MNPEWKLVKDALDAERRAGRRIVSTCGCFDILHAGHVRFLNQARALGDLLVVGLNGDVAVRQLKGEGRPRFSATDRATVLKGLTAVDHVVVFEDVLPLAFLEMVRPAIHCKGGDYEAASLPETRVVEAQGGEIRILPLLEGRSTTAALQGYGALSTGDPLVRDLSRRMIDWSSVVRKVGYSLAEPIAAEVRRMAECLLGGGRILVCGNGGSACDADHFAAELVGRFRRVRDGVSVISLVSGPGIVTALANDFGYEELFRRQLVAHARPGDRLVCFSTSGNSANVVNVLREARERGLGSTLLTGSDGGLARAWADVVLAIPSNDTVEIQQGHRAVMHALCEGLDNMLVEASLS